MAYGSIFHALGSLIAFLAIAMLLPGAVAWAGGDMLLARAFFGSAMLTAFAGVGLILSLRGLRRTTGVREAVLLSVMAFAFLPCFAALPFLIGLPGTGVPDAYFEAVSGLTTTGASALDPVLALRQEIPYAVYVWRAELQWLGGLGTLAVAVAVLGGIGHALLPVQTVPAPPALGDLGVPQLFAALRLVASLYGLMTVAILLPLIFLRVPFIEGLCVVFSSVSTGGFSPPGAMGGAVPDAAWLTPFAAAGMLGGTFNILLLWYALRGRWNVIWSDAEARYILLFLIVAFCVTVPAALAALPWSLPESLFNILSFATTTGFVVGDSLSPAAEAALPVSLLLILVLTGGAAVSTTGGLKTIRAVIMTKLSGRELGRLAHPHGVVVLEVGERPLGGRLATGVWTAFLGFVAVTGLTILIIALFGYDFKMSLLGAASAVGYTGPLLTFASGDPGAYTELPTALKLFLCFAMIAGRVEILALLSLVNPAYWRL